MSVSEKEREEIERLLGMVPTAPHEEGDGHFNLTITMMKKFLRTDSAPEEVKASSAFKIVPIIEGVVKTLESAKDDPVILMTCLNVVGAILTHHSDTLGEILREEFIEEHKDHPLAKIHVAFAIEGLASMCGGKGDKPKTL